MNLYHGLLWEVSARTEGSTLSHLKGMGRGKYASIVDYCIQKGLIESRRKNTVGEDLYFITEKGKNYLSNPEEEII